MRVSPWLLWLPLTVTGAESGSLANLVYLNDRLELHPRVGVGARYDSNVDATVTNPQDELAAIGTLGLGAQYAWSELTTLTADGEARLVVTDRPGEDRYRNQGSAQIALQRHTPENALGAHLAYARSDDPDEQTGERLLVDTWSADVDGELTGLVHRVSGRLAFSRNDYQQSSRTFSQDDRDENTFTATLGYGLHLQGGDELTVRLVADRVLYDHHTTNQDSTGAHGLVGWNRQVSETIGLGIEAGVEYRHYEAGAGYPASDILGPTWLVNGRTVTADDSTWSLTFSGGIEDTVRGNPSLASRVNLEYSHPFTQVCSGHLGIEAFNLEDLTSVAGQPKDERWTGRGTIGITYIFRPGLNGDLEGGYEYSDSRIEGAYDRVMAQAGVSARF